MSQELQNTQEQIGNFFSIILQKVEAGEIEPTNAYIFLKKLEKAFDDCKEKIYEQAKVQLDLYSQNELESLPYGASAKRIDRTTYEYKDNERYASIQKQLKSLEEIIKVATKNNTAVTDPETWEQIYAVPCKTTSIYQFKV